MKPKQPLNLSDLISLEGLTKPGEGEPTMEHGGKEGKQLKEVMTDLAGKMEDNKAIRTGDLASLVEAMKKPLARELSPENTEKILAKLKTRFEKKDKFYKPKWGMNWGDIEKRLRVAKEKLWSLNEMEETGGEPDVMGYDEETGEYIFIDCSAESPTKRRNCVYDREAEVELKKRDPEANYNGNAVSMAALMGINLLSESEYRDLQTKGDFDKNSWSWLKTPLDKRKSGVALCGLRDGVDVFVYERNAYDHLVRRGFRASLRV